MPEPDFIALRERLVQQGVAAGRARRLAMELAEHYDDLRLEAQRSGIPPIEADLFADERLGSADNIAAVVRSHEELLSWAYRYPHLARIALPLAFVALLPVAPLFTGVAHGAEVLRWTCCAMLSALFTAMLMWCMQLSITLT